MLLLLLPAPSVEAAIRQNHPTACPVARLAMVSVFTFAVGVVVVVRQAVERRRHHAVEKTLTTFGQNTTLLCGSSQFVLFSSFLLRRWLLCCGVF